MYFGTWSSRTEVGEKEMHHRGKVVGKVIRVCEKMEKKGGFYYKTREYEVVFYPPRMDKSFEVEVADYEDDGRQAWWAIKKKVKSILE